MTALSSLSVFSHMPLPPPDTPLGGNPVMLEGRVEIFPSSPLAWLNQPHAKAYAARAKGDHSSPLYALICEDGLPLRGDAFAGFMSCENKALLRFRDQGVVYWPPTNQNEQVIIIERPASLPLERTYNTPQPPLSGQLLIESFLKPMASLLDELARAGLAHGNIHLGNLFFNPQHNLFQLGEALSAPPSMHQPLLYNTVARGPCHPAGRGLPATGDDLYALGVISLILALGVNPWAGKSDDELLRLKIDYGSFFGLIGDLKLPPNLVDLFRGLLDDNPRRRWDLNNLQSWLGGRHVQPRALEADLKPTRPFNMNGRDHHTLRSVVQGLVREPLGAAASIENGELERWLLRSLESEAHATALKKATGSLLASPSRGSNFQEQLVARAAIALDPQGPVHYRGLSIMPNGAGYYLATIMIRGGNPQPLLDIMVSPLPALWLENQNKSAGDLSALKQQLDNIKAVLERRNVGFGIERVVYELLPMQPCLSPLLRKAQCRTIPDLLNTLEALAKDNVKRDPVDRHVAAFIMTRERRTGPGIGPLLNAIEGSADRAMGSVRLLGEAQMQQGPDKLPALTALGVHLLTPALKRFHQKDVQDKIKHDLQKSAEAGQLIKLLDAIDNPARLARDRIDFAAAQEQYLAVDNQIDSLKHDLDDLAGVEVRVGQPVAAGIAVLVGFVALGTVIIMYMMGTRLL